MFIGFDWSRPTPSTSSVSDFLAKRGWVLTAVPGVRGWLITPYQGEEFVPQGPLYHIAPKRFHDLILRGGLKPRHYTSSEFVKDQRYYEPRIYLFVSEEAARIASSRWLSAPDIELGDMFGKYRGEEEGYFIFEINPGELRRGTKFFKDPEMEDSVWTRTHIPAKAISQIDFASFTQHDKLAKYKSDLASQPQERRHIEPPHDYVVPSARERHIQHLQYVDWLKAARAKREEEEDRRNQEEELKRQEEERRQQEYEKWLREIASRTQSTEPNLLGGLLGKLGKRKTNAGGST